VRVDPHYVSNLVDALDSSQAQTQRLTDELSSGVRVTSISDDPLAAGQNVLLLNQMQQDDAFTQTSSLVTGQLQVADSALGQVVAQLNQAISVATIANNGTLNANDRNSAANQLAGIRGEILALANSSYQGQYIFAGGQAGTTPFSLSTATSPARVSYLGDQDVNSIVTPNGQQIQLNMPGDQVFLGGGATGVFAALNSLIANYSSANFDTTQAVKDTQGLGAALGYVSQQRVQLDNSITQLTAATGAANTEQTQLTAAQTNLMQADIAAVASQLSLSKTQQTALQAMFVQLASQSLFDKL
jgi:flagellar hook-associated protein 3 FlgL